MADALLLVDLQVDFCPGGALEVADGDQVLPVAAALMESHPLVVATQDWHPADHRSFASQHAGRTPGEMIDLDGLDQVLWPDHCVQGSAGAAFAAGVDADRFDHVVVKGTDRDVDSYSGFFDNGRRKATGMEQLLRGLDVSSLTVMGLATDYCVLYTALDAAELGFATTVVADGCRAVELAAGDGDRALDQMRSAGITVR
ncbi:MAG: bifunctional nicotinamidase/pyrazinamidase [Actinomycetota bacterium]